MVDDAPITIDYGETDQDCVDLHLFLCLVGGPLMIEPIDAHDSIQGIIEVRETGAIINAKKEGHLIGSLGLIKMNWWYNHSKFFLTNRWWAVLPAFKFAGVGAMLEGEAAAIGVQAGLPVIITSHAKRRKAAAKTEPFFMRDHLAVPAQVTE